MKENSGLWLLFKTTNATKITESWTIYLDFIHQDWFRLYTAKLMACLWMNENINLTVIIML